jgi:hypothetical protein
MAIGTASGFVIYQPQFWGGVIEKLQANTEVFNEASMNTIRLVTRSIKGNYEQESFLKKTAGLITRRDVDVMTTAADINLAHGEFVGVKVNRKIGPAAHSRDSFKKLGFDPKVFSFQLGEQVGVEIAADYANSAIMAVTASLQAVAALQYDATADTLKTLNHAAIVKTMAKFGDKSSRLSALLMHSKPYFDLMGNSITDKIVNVADVTIVAGSVATFGKPVIIADLTSLYNLDASGNVASYNVLMLTEGAVEVAESEDKDIVSQDITGLENLAIRIQGEHAYNLRVKGCAWDIANGGKNPSNTALALATNWDKIVADNKDMPGVLLKVQ